MNSEWELLERLLDHTIRTATLRLAEERIALSDVNSKRDRLGFADPRDSKRFGDVQVRLALLDSLMDQCSDLKAIMWNGAAGHIAVQAYFLGRTAHAAQVGKDTQAGWQQRKRARETQIDPQRDELWVKDYRALTPKPKSHTAACAILARKLLAKEISEKRAAELNSGTIGKSNISAWRQAQDKDEMHKRARTLAKAIDRTINRFEKKTGTLVRVSNTRHPIITSRNGGERLEAKKAKVRGANGAAPSKAIRARRSPDR